MNLTAQIATEIDNRLVQSVQEALNNLTKPLGSLGVLEKIVMHYCCCNNDKSAVVTSPHMYVFAADHGITAEGVTPYPKEVTTQMVLNMLSGGAAINVLCKNAGIGCTVVDVGVDGDFNDHPSLIKRKVSRGTTSFLDNAAMTAEQCQAALQTGYDIGSGTDASLFGIGEMGIGNTTAAAALAGLLLNKNASETAGMGTGSTGALFQRKCQVIDNALAYHRKGWDGSPVDALRRVGGLEIAAMTGAIFGAASKRKAVVVDGFIATAAALTAIRILPSIRNYLFFGHVSNESYHRSLLSEIEAEPILDLGMRLGEGSGAALAIQIIVQAMNCYHQMATFSSAGVANKDA
ncbi:MAG TPA: nicotinate-nucleotide--dimethylbenzimidazole phosphoribosyltransferase [Chitinispirillaceae bacterium]|nr:nicotinate-nucleotide--dimethylbenzimidazole phosphoribosyltransferase [Chitinispirillaceae bacterium]